MKKNKYILLSILWLIGSIALFMLVKLSPFLKPLFYWWILGLFIIIIWLFKLPSIWSLLFSFGLFILAGLLTTFGTTNLAELIMRISLIGWLVGFTQSFLEYLFKKAS